MLSLTNCIIVALMVIMVQSQSLVDVIAATPTGVAQAIGATVTGTAVIDVTPTTSFASATATATGTVSKIHPLVTKVHPKEGYPKYHPTLVPVKKAVVAPKCSDIKDCYKIDSVSYCGYCILEKYPTKGQGCEYEPIYEKGDKKKGTTTGYTPKCECKGTFIHDKAACPSCESVLVELLTCANKKDLKDMVEIPTLCVNKVKVSVEYLAHCGLYEAPPATKKTIVTPALGKNHFITLVMKPVNIGKLPYASASAQAASSAFTVGKGSAVGASASSSAIADGQVALADADAVASSG